jgi:hypothetical protein
MWSMTWRTQVHFVVEDVVTPVHYVGNDVASICTRCGGCRGEQYELFPTERLHFSPTREAWSDVRATSPTA